MSWQCPECGGTNADSILRCMCGHEWNELHRDIPEAGIDENLQQMVLASASKRLGNLLLDWIFFLVLIFAIEFMFDVMASLLRTRNPIEGIDGLLFGIIISFFYYVPQEAFSGRTLGKMITGTKAVNEDGTKLTFGRALGRTLCRLIPFEPFSFLGGKGGPRGWHDTIPKTKVISVEMTGSFSSRLANSVFTKLVFIFSWIITIGLSVLIFIKWVFPFLMPPFEVLLLILIFLGVISANGAKRKGKSPLLWFFLGLIPIGFLYLIALQILRIIVFYILAAGEL